MTTPVVSSTTMLLSPISDESQAPVTRAYRTKTSFVAVYFPQPGRGQVVFLPEGAMLRVLRPSSCLPEGFEVLFEKQTYNVFEIDLLARSNLIHDPIEAEGRAVAARLNQRGGDENMMATSE
jgi:hypothetical protein